MEDYDKSLELSSIDGVEIYFDTKWLFNKTLGADLNSADLLVRLLAIDNYIGKNDFGFALYNEMKQKRIATNNEIPNASTRNYEKDFKKLIKSISENGYIDKNPVELNKNFEVFDGAHRLVCALALNIEKIPVRFSSKYINKNYDYSIEWFKKNGLTYMEEPILKKYKELKDKKIILGD